MKNFFYFFLFFFTLEIHTHEFNPAHLVVEQSKIDTNKYEATWMYPYKNIGKRAEVIFSEVCTKSTKQPYLQGKYLVEKINLVCEESLKGTSIEIIDLSVLTDALITINFIDNTFEGIVNVQNFSIDIPKKNQYYPTSYLLLGINHLFDGLDHILFIFGLIFCISGLFNIIKTITAFTVAHSFSLGLSVFNVISLPQGTVEALIALTIVYLALEVSKSNKSYKTPWLMAFGFGLLHGLGFAGALMDIGIANNQMFLSLVFFNLGIELAQLALIPIPLLIIYISKQYTYSSQVKTIASFSIGGMGFYWFIDRVIGIIL